MASEALVVLLTVFRRPTRDVVRSVPARVLTTLSLMGPLLLMPAVAVVALLPDYRIRVYTIGMGELVQLMLGTMPEKPEDILKRIANDKRSPDYNSAQLEGKYYYAKTGADVGPAFQALQNPIIRLGK